jgi:type IV secretory pathway VirB10-like protein
MTADMDSPTGLDMHPRPPAAVRVRKSVGIAIMIGLGLIAATIVYGVYERQQRQLQVSLTGDVDTKATPATVAARELTAEIFPGDVPVVKDRVASLEDQVNGPAKEVVLPSSTPRTRSAVPFAPGLPYQSPVERPTDTDRDRAYQKEQEAIEAPTGIGSGARTFGMNTNTPAPDALPVSSIASALNPAGTAVQAADVLRARQTGEYSAQNGQDEKAAFIAQSRSRLPDNALASVRTAPATRFEIKAGWDIPCTLEQAINSDQPGEIKALVRENVCDTATGKYVLLPQGSQLTGSYNSVVSYGQDGVQAVWDRIIFPDGSSLNLNGMIGQDAQGQSGLRYSVDHHYARLLGFAVMTSLFSAGFQLSQNRPGTILATPSSGEVIAGAVGAQISQTGIEITRRNLNVQPTIKVPAGYRFNVRVNRDIVFDAPYSRRR